MKESSGTKRTGLYRNSIFFKLLFPVALIAALQILLITLVFWANGTLQALRDDAVDALYQNARNRAISLENNMVQSWSNIANMEEFVLAEIDSYLSSTGHSEDEFFTTYAYMTEVLVNVSEAMLLNLRLTSSTGVFCFFTEKATVKGDVTELTGAYLRDVYPKDNPSSGYSDVTLEVGSTDISKLHGIIRSSTASLTYECPTTYPETYDAIFNPINAAIEHPTLTTNNLSYWSEPHYLKPNIGRDAATCITYTRPLMYKGRPIGVIGTEVQITHMQTFFPSSDLSETGQGGYALINYQALENADDDINCKIFATTGLDIYHLFDSSEASIKFDRENVYTYSSSAGSAKVTVKNLLLYNSNTPFSGGKWALASVALEDRLYSSASMVWSGIAYSTIISFLTGFILITIVIRRSTSPLKHIVEQLNVGSPSDHVFVHKSGAYEIKLLCETINALTDKRLDMESKLREERERYMIALESATDIFMEYDLERDRFKLYYFSDKDNASPITSRDIENFSTVIYTELIVHNDDAASLMNLLKGNSEDDIQLRIISGFFPGAASEVTDSGYDWFSFKASRIRDKDDRIIKTVVSARLITSEKLRELAEQEASRRDFATGLYNSEYGKKLITEKLDYSGEQNTFFFVISVDDFQVFEAYYGRVYSAVVMHYLAALLTDVFPSGTLVRLSNSEFSGVITSTDRSAIISGLMELNARAEKLYMGESADNRLALSAGVVEPSSTDKFDEILEKACYAAKCAQKGDGLVFFNDLGDTQDFIGKKFTHLAATPALVSISKVDIVGFTFSMFEHTSDIKSVVNMLLKVLGELYSFDRILLSGYDQDFGASQILYEWAASQTIYSFGEIRKFSHDEFNSYCKRLDENNILVFNANNAAEFEPSTKRMLYMPTEGAFSAICCAMVEKGAHVGRILFYSNQSARAYDNVDIHALYEVSKIISTNLSLDKSNIASKAKSEFLSRMSHEIRTPMNAIIGMTKIAKEATTKDRLEDSLEKIDRSAKHLLSLINDVLDMSRIESGKMQLSLAPFSLKTMVSDLEVLMRIQAEDKKLNFSVDCRTENSGVIGDEQKLRQVLINLLSNAFKFTREGGSVKLSVLQTEQSGDSSQYRFSVKDTGVGIKESDQLVIFDSFEQSDFSNNEAGRPKGTGLGLAISSSFINMMGGKISVDSVVGKGSEFYFEIKLKRSEISEQSDAAGTERKEYKKDYFKGKRVLIVEDNAINLEIAKYIVDSVGFEYETAENGQLGVEKFLASKSGYFDIIFMDISMPVMDGLTATREIRKNRQHPDAATIPIIAMTANAFGEDTKKSVDSGMNGHIAKPIDVDQLFILLDKLLK